MWAVQFLGVLLVPAAVAVVAFVARKWRLGIALLLLIPLKLFFEKVIVKELVYRARPGTSDCGGDPTCLELRDVPMVGPSFPSGHVIIAFGIAWLVFPYLGAAGDGSSVASAFSLPSPGSTWVPTTPWTCLRVRPSVSALPAR